MRVRLRAAGSCAAGVQTTPTRRVSQPSEQQQGVNGKGTSLVSVSARAFRKRFYVSIRRNKGRFV